MADSGKSSKMLADWRKLAEADLRGKPVAGLDWHTPEGITVKPLYTEADLEEIAAAGFPFRAGGARAGAVSARAARDDVRQPAVDDPAVFRLFDRRGEQPLLPRQPQGRADGPVDRLRSRDASRL